MSAHVVMLDRTRAEVDDRGENGIWLNIYSGGDRIGIALWSPAKDDAGYPTLAELIRPVVEWAVAHPELADPPAEPVQAAA